MMGGEGLINGMCSPNAVRTQPLGALLASQPIVRIFRKPASMNVAPAPGQRRSSDTSFGPCAEGSSPPADATTCAEPRAGGSVLLLLLRITQVEAVGAYMAQRLGW